MLAALFFENIICLFSSWTVVLLNPAKMLKRAHDTLSDPYRRKIYDSFGEQGLEFIDEVKKRPGAGIMTERSFTMEQVLRLDCWVDRVHCSL